MKIIHLTSTQRLKRAFSNPLLDAAKAINEEEIDGLLSASREGNRAAREKLILGNLGIVKSLVGRFLHYWPDSRRFEDDMVGAGAEAVVEMVDSYRGDSKYLRPSMVLYTKRRIETLLNNLRSPVHASLETNYRRVRDGLEPEYGVVEPLTTEAMSPSVENDDTIYIDILDSLERFQELDSEEMVDRVLDALEKYYSVSEADLSEADLDLLFKLSKLGGRCA